MTFPFQRQTAFSKRGGNPAHKSIKIKQIIRLRVRSYNTQLCQWSVAKLWLISESQCLHPHLSIYIVSA